MCVSHRRKIASSIPLEHYTFLVLALHVVLYLILIVNLMLILNPHLNLKQVEDCIDLTLEPRPVGYGATRRMARRFDETLIVEVEMVATKEASGRIF